MKIAEIMEGFGYQYGGPAFGRDNFTSGIDSAMHHGKVTVSREVVPATSLRSLAPDRGVTIRTVKFGPDGIDGKCVITDDEWEGIRNLKLGRTIKFVDRNRRPWRITHSTDGFIVFQNMASPAIGGSYLWDEFLNDLSS